MSVDGDVRGDRAFAQILHELPHVIGLVGPQRDAAAPFAPVQHRKRGLAFGGAAGLRDATVHRQAVAVLHQDMADIAKPGRLTVSLLVEPRLGIGRAGMRLVGALLLVEVAFGVAARPLGVLVAPVLAAEALDRRPRLDQCPVHREMIA